MSEELEPEIPQQGEEEEGLEYSPSKLPNPTNNKEEFMRALLVEARLIRKILSSVDRSLKAQTRAAQEQARAVKKATR